MPPVSNNDIDDTNEESVWHNTFTGKPLTYTPPPWMGSEFFDGLASLKTMLDIK